MGWEYDDTNNLGDARDGFDKSRQGPELDYSRQQRPEIGHSPQPGLMPSPSVDDRDQDDNSRGGWKPWYGNKVPPLPNIKKHDIIN